jgi:predicted PurR-regulated permease PerM
MAAGVLSILPFIGPAVGLIPSAIILFFDSYQVLPLIVLVLVFVAIEGIEGYLLYPLFLGKDLELNPLSIIVSLFAGGALLGFLGVLLAVPMFCVVKILFRELVFPHIQALAAESPK